MEDLLLKAIDEVALEGPQGNRVDLQAYTICSAIVGRSSRLTVQQSALPCCSKRLHRRCRGLNVHHSVLQGARWIISGSSWSTGMKTR